ncbi:Hypothetical predicted protein, partial [Olea europaea subsp. europaea]
SGLATGTVYRVANSDARHVFVRHIGQTPASLTQTPASSVKIKREAREDDRGKGNNCGDCQQLRADHSLRQMRRTIAENHWLDPVAPRHEVPAMRCGHCAQHVADHGNDPQRRETPGRSPVSAYGADPQVVSDGRCLNWGICRDAWPDHRLQSPRCRRRNHHIGSQSGVIVSQLQRAAVNLGH